ncbi:hypothetical protein [Sneathiella sp. HT1-7]|uniref:hypothetical protein n=1 Tax=Sneathiella sp. HT1-7 TaxID=2887192 RepID=UPI001D13D6CA|nr:hypothetical protein [Sneathiella sp. HT1-7]MCC3303494.1 hypothetical protein [Sneathiella sp. HT1-7]
MRYLIILVGFLVLVSCADKGNETGEPSIKMTGDPTTDAIYNELMARILGSKISSVNNNSNNRPGQINSYRNGIARTHKALAACLLWDEKNLQVPYKFWNSSGSSDWSYSSFQALDNCDKHKLQKIYDCKCQLIDHDDVNVLEVPEDYRAAYDRSKST